MNETEIWRHLDAVLAEIDALVPARRKGVSKLKKKGQAKKAKQKPQPLKTKKAKKKKALVDDRW
jgi:hypothetical protein